MAWKKLFWWGLSGALVAACSRDYANAGGSSEGGKSGEGGVPLGGGGSGASSAKGGGGSPVETAGNAGDALGGTNAGANAGANPGSGGEAGHALGGEPNTSMGGAGGDASGGGGAGGGNEETEVACPKDVQGHCSAGASYPSYTGYTLALVEDFPAALDLDADPVFTWADGGGDNTQTGYRRDNISFSGGEMVIVADSDCAASTNNSHCYPARKSYSEAISPNTQADLHDMGVWSGSLRSRYDNYRYGRYEVKMRAPAGNPMYPDDHDKSGNSYASMFVFRTPRNLQWVEIDANLEAWNRHALGTDVVSAAGEVNWPFAHSAGVQETFSGNINEEHVYAFNWTSERIEWFIDGESVRIFPGSIGDPLPTLSAKIVLSLTVGDGTDYAGDPGYNIYPLHAHFDYFRFYRLDTEATYPCANVPSCLDPADKSKSSQNNPNEVSYGQ